MKRYKGKTIRRRSDGRWWVRFRQNGKQVSVYGRTQAECLDNLKEALKQQNKGNKPTSNLTLGEWLDKWLKLYKIGKVKPSTLEQMQRYLKVVEPIANIKLKKLTAIDVQEFLNSIDKPRKREKLHLFLKDALTKAVKNKLITSNLFDGVTLPKRTKKQSIALTHEEERLFVAECRERPQGDLFLFCLYQGLRLGEALALTYSDIDFNKKTITVNKSLDGFGNVTTPKTATSTRTLPLFNRAAKLLSKTGQGNIFVFRRKTYQNTMLKICEKLNLQNVSVHTLRHTFATRCAEAGVAVKVVQKWLGHSTLEMTLNTYTHVNADFEAKEAIKFDTQFDTHEE
ncbi:MAG: site-specific integrase [Corallococcus sp.]|nr:site-specific integrase [Corallococcus sp.]